MSPTFEWDREKALANERKHGISFREAATVFAEWGAPVDDDIQHSFEEDRFIIIAMSEEQRLLTVSFTNRGEDTIRIISARRATAREKRQYEQEKRSD